MLSNTQWAVASVKSCFTPIVHHMEIVLRKHVSAAAWDLGTTDVGCIIGGICHSKTKNLIG